MAVSSNASNLNIPGSVAAGTATYCGEMSEKCVSVEGAFTGTYQTQLSSDPANPPSATSWINEGAAFIAPGNLYVPKAAIWLRLNCTAFTSSPPAARVCGFVKY